MKGVWDQLIKQRVLTALTKLKGSTRKERAFLVTGTLELRVVVKQLGTVQQNGLDAHLTPEKPP